MMTEVKAKAISKYMNECPSSPLVVSKVLACPDPKTEATQEDIDRYGYGYMCRTPRKQPSISSKMSRRSSLKAPVPVPRRASIGYTGEMVLTLPTGEKKKKRTSISFEESESVVEILPLTDMVEDPNRLWFHQKELRDIKKEVLKVLKELTEKKGEENGTRSWICTRGLEPLLFHTNDARDSKDSVLEEYAIQKSRGEYDEAHIRDMYTFQTIDAQVQAIERAEHDASEVERDLKLSRLQCRRMSC
jgi:hypothetical protein